MSSDLGKNIAVEVGEWHVRCLALQEFFYERKEFLIFSSE